MTIDSKTRRKPSLTQIRTGMLWLAVISTFLIGIRCGRCDIECSMGIQPVPDNLSDAECIRCLECLETCTRGGGLALKIGKP